MTGRTLAGVAVLAAAVAGGGALAASGGEEPAATAAAAGGSSSSGAPSATARVERGALSAMVALPGTLTYRARPDGSPYVAVNQARGVYTRLPEVGDAVGCGEVLYRVDDEPVLLLCGTVPSYRDLAIGDAGRDVRQLNRALHRLRFDRRAGVKVDPADRDFTWRTREALERLQRAQGLGGEGGADGTLDRGDAVVLPRPVRIAKVTGRLGAAARPGAEVVQATSGTLEVRVELDPAQQGEVRPGDRARIALPGNATVNGRVARLGRVARAAQENDDAGAAAATIPATIRLTQPEKARGLDRAPVRVEIRTEGVRDALSVPVTALVGRAGGGFAVEVVRARGRRELVAVELGLVDTTAGRVAVEGALRAGDAVVVPAS